jgi:hypothetical protein
MSLLLAAAGLTACDSYPRDIAGTRDHVAETRQLRVGYGRLPARQRAIADRFVARIAEANGTTLTVRQEDSNEGLFAALETGRLDLVMTEVAKDSPWVSEVAVIEPLLRRRLAGRELGLSPVARNGENRWIMLLEGTARDMKGPP